MAVSIIHEGVAGQKKVPNLDDRTLGGITNLGNGNLLRETLGGITNLGDGKLLRETLGVNAESVRAVCRFWAELWPRRHQREGFAVTLRPMGLNDLFKCTGFATLCAFPSAQGALGLLAPRRSARENLWYALPEGLVPDVFDLLLLGLAGLERSFARFAADAVARTLFGEALDARVETFFKLPGPRKSTRWQAKLVPVLQDSERFTVTLGSGDPGGGEQLFAELTIDGGEARKLTAPEEPLRRTQLLAPLIGAQGIRADDVLLLGVVLKLPRRLWRPELLPENQWLQPLSAPRPTRNSERAWMHVLSGAAGGLSLRVRDVAGGAAYPLQLDLLATVSLANYRLEAVLAPRDEWTPEQRGTYDNLGAKGKRQMARREL